MKNYIFLCFLFLLIFTGGCCDDTFLGPVVVNILKDNKPLKDQNISPVFYYKDSKGIDITLRISASTDGRDFSITQTSDLEKLSFKPAIIYIKYYGLPEIDTLEILLDYACDNKIGRAHV